MFEQMLGPIFGMLNILEDVKKGDYKSLLSFSESQKKKQKKQELETNMFMEFVTKTKKAKRRGRRRVQQNYIKACRELGFIPWGFATEDEKERMEYGNRTYGGYGY